jgi:hypothetical protein
VADEDFPALDGHLLGVFEFDELAIHDFIELIGRVDANEALEVADEIAPLSIRDFPVQPPTLFAPTELQHRIINADGRISNLPSLRNWNRTLGLGHVLNELENEWSRRPPQQGIQGSLYARLRAWVVEAWRR